MKSKTINVNSSTELRTKIQEAITTDFQPTLAIIFNSIQHKIEEIQSVCNQLDIDMVGCTTAGEIVDNELLEESIAVLLMDMNRDYYTIKRLNTMIYRTKMLLILGKKWAKYMKMLVFY
ncbi:MAG: hypothetical protein HC803_07755 [Saprospiraceae bacterium]|nr:hypothetical protein [Saprospiraceae bacterium]